MTCAECEHPLAWHGDRAIGACDGGWDRVHSLNRTIKAGAGTGVPLCNCPGWRGGE